MVPPATQRDADAAVFSCEACGVRGLTKAALDKHNQQRAHKVAQARADAMVFIRRHHVVTKATATSPFADLQSTLVMSALRPAPNRQRPVLKPLDLMSGDDAESSNTKRRDTGGAGTTPSP